LVRSTRALIPSDILGTLADLCQRRAPGRRSREQITVFKAVGTGLSDLAAGALARRNRGIGAV